ncbi:MAG: TetR family transcriptional regulator [Catenulispora sp.]|nr:TetR family transcriptional regulator [Catenulispora sp.]
MPPTASTPTNRTALTPAPIGLRERKKAQTRAAIQRHALHLFQRDGYHATTMEQIAAAAEVSPSTLYRYFPTKEDLVLQDDYDPVTAAAFRAQPADLPVLEAFRAAVEQVLAMTDPRDREETILRARLSFAIPEVRARTLDHMLSTADMIAELFAERLGRPVDDLGIRVLAGSIIGAMLGAQQVWIADPDADLLTVTVDALQCLIDGPAALTRQTPPAAGA